MDNPPTLGAAALLPPQGFHPAGTVISAARSPRPAFVEKPPRRPPAARHQRGVHYESAVRVAVGAWAHSAGHVADFGPWYRFTASDGDARWCQPDAVIDFGREHPLAVIEIKHQFVPLAWWQLVQLYAPVLNAATGRTVRCASICKSFDPFVRASLPAYVSLSLRNPHAWLDALCCDTDPGWYELPLLQWRAP